MRGGGSVVKSTVAASPDKPGKDGSTSCWVAAAVSEDVLSNLTHNLPLLGLRNRIVTPNNYQTIFTLLPPYLSRNSKLCKGNKSVQN